MKFAYRSRLRQVLYSWLVLYSASQLGCGAGDNLDRQPVTGEITLDGQPLATGTVRFEPSAQDAGTEVTARVQGGKYAFGKTDGPVPGPYKIQISSIEDPKFVAPAGKTPGEVLVPLAKERVPEKYNFKSELTTSVKAGQSEPINFSLTSK